MEGEGRLCMDAIAPAQLFLFNPFRPTGPFLAPKLIILIKYLISFSIFISVVLMFLYVEQGVNLAWKLCLGLKN